MVAAHKRAVAHCNIAHSDAQKKSLKFEETIVHTRIRTDNTVKNLKTSLPLNFRSLF